MDRVCKADSVYDASSHAIGSRKKTSARKARAQSENRAVCTRREFGARDMQSFYRTYVRESPCDTRVLPRSLKKKSGEHWIPLSRPATSLWSRFPGECTGYSENLHSMIFDGRPKCPIVNN